ncbi:MAG: oligoribonuclease [Acidimicrobiia bacterium]
MAFEQDNNPSSNDKKSFKSRAPKPSKYLVWADCEMTGLDIETDTLVEIAIVVTDNDLNVIDEGIDIVIQESHDKLDSMSDVVKKMHEKSGLTKEILKSNISVTQAEQTCLDYLKKLGIKGGSAPLCGNSIGVDRRFINKYMPNLEFFLHYRSIDVSSFKELCRRWYPDVFEKRPEKLGEHRALGDILGSIDEMKYYRDNILK